MTIREQIKLQYDSRVHTPDRLPLKVNLFKGYEVEAVSRCVARLLQSGTPIQIDSVMLGDSLLTTHLGYETTALDDPFCRVLFQRVFNEHIHEIRIALTAARSEGFNPYLIGDMPFGSAAHVESALRSAEAMVRSGADVLKIEAYNSDMLDAIEELATSGYTLMGHIGYTPQIGGRKSRGVNFEDARELFKQAQRVRDAGASALVLEGVSTVVNACLSAPHPHGLPIYAIFSGRAAYSGLSLNVWDSVVRPPFRARHFPPSAILNVEDLPARYTPAVIEEQFESLVRMVAAREWPEERKHSMTDEELVMLRETKPWDSGTR